MDPHRPQGLSGLEPTGFQGYPVGTVAFYGPDDRRVSKIVAAVMLDEAGTVGAVQKWAGDDLDQDKEVMRELASFFAANPTQSLVLSDGIVGCPHDEGHDYPAGGDCPLCPFWSGRRSTLREATLEPQARMVVGFLYFREEQWDRWYGSATDQDTWHDSWEQWRHETHAKIRHLRAASYEVQWVPVDVEEFLAQCGEQGRDNDAASRSDYLHEQMKK